MNKSISKQLGISRDELGDLLLARIKVTAAGCFEWRKMDGTASRNRKAILTARVGRRTKKIHANRASWESFRGQIGRGGQVLSSCDNPICINPAHLILAANPDERGRHLANTNRVAFGGRKPNTRLSEKKVVEARQRYQAGESFHRLARRFRVSVHTMRAAIHGESWRRVSDAPPIEKVAPHPSGVSHKLAKLDEDKVREIRRRRKAGAKLSELAKEFDTIESNISWIVRRKGWKHVE